MRGITSLKEKEEQKPDLRNRLAVFRLNGAGYLVVADAALAFPSSATTPRWRLGCVHLYVGQEVGLCEGKQVRPKRVGVDAFNHYETYRRDLWAKHSELFR